MKRLHLIVNPQSGSKKGLHIRDIVISQLKKSDYEVLSYVSEYKGHPLELTKNLKLNTSDLIGVIGGDGTMHEVINGLLQRKDKMKVPIGLIPAGTGNSLMHDLNCLNPKEAVKRIIFGKKRKLDILKINSGAGQYYSFNIIGWGIPSWVNIVAEKIRYLGGQRYNLASLIELVKNKSSWVSLTMDGNTVEGQYGFILACNTKYTGNGLKMAPGAEFDDGLVELITTTRLSRIRLLFLFIKLFRGTHLSDPAISVNRVKAFSVRSTEKMPLNIDGQIIGTSPFSVEMMQGHLEIFV